MQNTEQQFVVRGFIVLAKTQQEAEKNFEENRKEREKALDESFAEATQVIQEIQMKHMK